MGPDHACILDEDADAPREADLWFLPGPVEDDPLPPGRRAALGEAAALAEWRAAEAGLAARLARVAGRLGALDERLRAGPEGWRHRLALIEAAELSWLTGVRVGTDRLALWVGLRLSGVQDDAAAFARAAWAVRRLEGGPGPEAGLPGLPGFLGRHAAQAAEEPLSDRAEGWLALMAAARDLHPITRACLGCHLWALAGLSPSGDRLEAAVVAARVAATGGGGAVFAPLAMGGAGGLRAGGKPAERLAAWLEGMDRAILAALRHLDGIEAWSARAGAAIAPLSGRTPPALVRVLTVWPVVSAPLAEDLTGASRAAVQRNLDWMERHDLIREITGLGRFRMWRAAV